MFLETQILETPHRRHVSLSPDRASSGRTPTPHHFFQIEDIRQSESAWVTFARHTKSKRLFVLKCLKGYKDATRYSLDSFGARQECLLEALEWNRLFTPGVYIGIAPIRSFDVVRKLISIDKIIENPTREMLTPGTEYILIMHPLPDEKRLDYLLGEADGVSLDRYIKLLLRRVIQMHSSTVPDAPLAEDGTSWGNFSVLQKKLADNFIFLGEALKADKNGLKKTYYPWFASQTTELPQRLQQSCFPDYFEQRVKDNRIKRCHADLKAPNIWIFPRNTSNNEEQAHYVWLLDTIDFNPLFSNIDILSDFAMLVIDIQVRMKTPDVANRMIKEYLQLTNQNDKVSSAVLAYYMIEKAIVGAAVSVIDDKMPDFSKKYLEVAKMRLEEFMTLLSKRSQFPISNILPQTAEIWETSNSEVLRPREPMPAL